MTEGEVDARGGAGGSRAPGYELTDISTRVVVVFALALVIAGIVIHVLVWLLYAYFGQATAASYSRQFPLAAVGPAPLPAAPMLQVKPREELKQLRAEEDAILASYGWVDPAAGIVHIPIDRAMHLTIERGLPVRGAGGDAAAVGQASRLPNDPASTVGQASRLPANGGRPTQGAASGPMRK